MSNKILYLAFARMPTEKAHGFTIAKACESFAQAGKNAELWVPKRHTSILVDLFSAYHLQRNFTVHELRVPDLIRVFGRSRGAFAIQFLLFTGAAKARLIFAKRRGVIIYTREAFLLLFSWLGYHTVLECHAISRNTRWYFFLARRASRIIVISEALKKAFIEAGFRAENILVAPSGVDLSVFDISSSREEARQKLSLPVKETLAVYTGNFTTMGQDKGISDIIRALKEAPGIILVAAGGTLEDIARYEAEARDAGVSDRVILRPHAPQAELALYQCAADMLLMPFPDTPHYRKHMSPVKMFEYMAGRRAIIASDLPTIREVLDDETAFFVPPGDTHALGQALMTLASDESLRTRLADAAYKKVGEYSWQKRAERVLTFIDSEATKGA